LDQERDVELLFNLESFGIRAPARESGSPDNTGLNKENTQTALTLNGANERRDPNADRPDTAQAPAAFAEPGENRPWMQPYDPVAVSRTASNRLNLRQRALQMQSGLNPMRGRSIQDVIDEQWRQSRYEQLGHPIPPEAGSVPAVSPYEKALAALKEAWVLSEDMRQRLTSEIFNITGLRATKADDETPDDDSIIKHAHQSLEQLETERISLTTEIDSLKQKKQETREQLIAELERDYSLRIEESEQKLNQLNDMIAKSEQQAASAREIALTAERAAADIICDDFDKNVMSRIAEGRAGDLMNAMMFGRMLPAPAAPALRRLSYGELISDVCACFEGAGMPVSNDEAVNLLACLYINKLTLISGAAGSGKSLTARLLAAILGLTDSFRYAEIQASGDWTNFGNQIISASPYGVPIEKRPAIRRLLAIDDDSTPTVLMIDDANRIPIERYAGELLECCDHCAPAALSTECGAIALHPQLRIIMTICDEGDIAPLTIKALDRAFMIRLDPVSAQTPIDNQVLTMPIRTEAVSLAALAQMFDCARAIPDELTNQLNTLRLKMSEYGISISRRSVLDINRYLAAVLPLIRRDPMSALDLAFSQRALPAILASANMTALHALPELLTGLPKCQALLTQPVPLPPL
jgi:hypothetical protein